MGEKSETAMNNYFKNHLATLIKQVRREDYYQTSRKPKRAKKEERQEEVMKRLERLVNVKSKYKYQEKVLAERASILKYYSITIEKKKKQDQDDSSDVISDDDLQDRDWLKNGTKPDT